MKGGRLERIGIWLLPPLIGMVARLLFFTCRVNIRGGEHLRATVGSGQPVVASFWHYSTLGVFPVLCKYKGVIMVSSSRDGEYIARLGRFFGYTVVRGSRNRQGVTALKELIRAVKRGESAGIVADGSQGPPRIAQPGALLAASMGGVPVLPVAWSASRYWAIRSWDRTAFPKPFSRVEFAFGEPLAVPAKLAPEEVESYRLHLEQRLNAMYVELWRQFGRETH